MLYVESNNSLRFLHGGKWGGDALRRASDKEEDSKDEECCRNS
jgi:hypothetical protein